jgi:hypothetical protein
MYSWVIGHSQQVLQKFIELSKKVDNEVEEQKQMIEIKSKLDTLKTCHNILVLNSSS